MNSKELNKLREKMIKEFPVTTNNLVFDWNPDMFFKKYCIVSYSGTDKNKTPPYRYLSDIPCMSECCMGVVPRNGGNRIPRFFLLCLRGEQNKITDALRKYETLAVCSDDRLDSYKEIEVHRILTGLCLNSIGRSENTGAIHSHGKLIIDDAINFDNDPEEARVCLFVDVDYYMNLVGRTFTLTTPKKVESLQKEGRHVFKLSRLLVGDKYEGTILNSVTPKDFGSNPNINDYFIKCQNNKKKRFNVPYWIYNQDKYTHCKLFVISQLFDFINNKYKGLVKLRWKQYNILDWHEYTTSKDTEDILFSSFVRKNIYIEDCFNDKESRKMTDKIKRELLVCDASFRFVNNKEDADMIIIYCEEKPSLKSKKALLTTNYVQGEKRINFAEKAIQHVIIKHKKEEEVNEKKEEKVNTNDEITVVKDNSMNQECPCLETDEEDLEENAQISDMSDVEGKAIKVSAKIKKIWMELFFKTHIIDRTWPSGFSDSYKDWEFVRYKIHEHNVLGAKLHIKNGKLEFDDFGFDNQLPYEDFFLNEFNFRNEKLFYGSQDYMALKKNGNVYMIINTQEIPMLDADLIIKGYEAIDKSEGMLKPSFFKNKTKGINEDPINNRRYFGGYLGVTIWKNEGLPGSSFPGYSYISGWNGSSIQMRQGGANGAIHRMPHVKKIFVLEAERPDEIENDIYLIRDMLRYGFARWNEQMSYPLPFKFLLEYLDNKCKIFHLRHWEEITFKEKKEKDKSDDEDDE